MYKSLQYLLHSIKRWGKLLLFEVSPTHRNWNFTQRAFNELSLSQLFKCKCSHSNHYKMNALLLCYFMLYYSSNSLLNVQFCWTHSKSHTMSWQNKVAMIILLFWTDEFGMRVKKCIKGIQFTIRPKSLNYLDCRFKYRILASVKSVRILKWFNKY